MDIITGHQTALILNQIRGLASKKGTRAKPISLADTTIKFRRPKKRQTPEEQLGIAIGIVHRTGGTVDMTPRGGTDG